MPAAVARPVPDADRAHLGRRSLPSVTAAAFGPLLPYIEILESSVEPFAFEIKSSPVPPPSNTSAVGGALPPPVVGAVGLFTVHPVPPCGTIAMLGSCPCSAFKDGNVAGGGIRRTIFLPPPSATRPCLLSFPPPVPWTAVLRPVYTLFTFSALDLLPAPVAPLEDISKCVVGFVFWGF